MAYPSITDNNFNVKFTNKFEKYRIPKKRKSFDQICWPKSYELQPQQNLLSQVINPKAPYKGILLFHGIGSGKTCTSINIAEQWKHERKIMVVTAASLIHSYRDELRTECTGNTYMTDKERKEIKHLAHHDERYIHIIKKTDERINKYYNMYSYNKFVKYVQLGQLNFRNTLLIIDEIQNMISDDGIYYKVLYETIMASPKDLRLILLSATPMFDKPNEIALIMNLLRIPKELPVGREFFNTFVDIKKNYATGQIKYTAKNIDLFKQSIKGYVSYYRGAPPFVYPETTIKYVQCPMEKFQYRGYITSMKYEEVTHKSNKPDGTKTSTKAFTEGQLDELSTSFFIGSRLVSNVCFLNKGIKQNGIDSFTGKYLDMENLKNYSIKFYKIMRKINKSTRPVVVYSNFLTYGIYAFIKVLEHYGYSDYANSRNTKKKFAVFSGNETKEYKHKIKTVFNNMANVKGAHIKVILLSQSAKEGLSLYNVEQMHIMDVYWNMSMIKQIMGRAVRFCSHKNLDDDDRNVKIFVYLATHPNEKSTIDQYMLRLSREKESLTQEFETAIKEVAVDCELNKNANVFTDLGEKDIQCDA
jgi:superfamily II DNA or RNA helicase